MTEYTEHICPFCSEADFDLYGLKMHLEMGWCDAFNALERELPTPTNGTATPTAGRTET